MICKENLPRKCFVLEARRQALEADVVVVNHHLFFADVVLRDEGVGELLPACNTVIFDEAHQLPETASLFFGDHMSTSQLVELAINQSFSSCSESAHACRRFASAAPACRDWTRSRPSATCARTATPNSESASVWVANFVSDAMPSGLP